jgi:hypothetical protein
LNFDACVFEAHFFWWDCYLGSSEVPKNPDPHNGGWQASNSTTFEDTEIPPIPWGIIGWQPSGIGDPLRLAMECRALVVICFDGKYAVEDIPAMPGLLWNWDEQNRVWSGPTDEANTTY